MVACLGMNNYLCTILTETITNEKKKRRIPGFGIFLSGGLRKRKRKKISEILICFVSVACCCGLCVPDMIIMRAIFNAKEKSGELFAFPLRERKWKIISRSSFVMVSMWMVLNSAMTVSRSGKILGKFKMG